MGEASLWILIFHEWQPIFNSIWIFKPLEEYIKRIGFCGVDIFLFLSGMGMPFAIQKGIKTYYARRASRILPPYIVAALLMKIAGTFGWGEFWKNITGYNFIVNNIYSFLWYVPAIAILYLLFPIYWRTINSSKINTVIILLLWLLLTTLCRNISRQDIFGFTNRIPVFLVGVEYGTYNLTPNKDNVKTADRIALLITMLVAGIYLSYLTNYRDYYLMVPQSNCFLPNILIGISVTLLTAYFFEYLNYTKGILRKFSIHLNTIFTHIGSISLELYCVQEWVGNSINTKLYGLLNNICLNILIFSVTIIAALLMRFAIEYARKYILLLNSHMRMHRDKYRQ
ncbi:acyltransferase family protein [Blautia massiliensis (ex Durand et al. 2017)]|uniref:acyltransferase family protein n=1 Tax=Blautia massiliensis (ex Durand et al. 2017) TaxID=1737424 RepID=UPI00242F61C2|nr:acyltransferase [Blautia massiliensis (ex Durand et al. 2017)]MDD6547310.1 acyltransferase [Blautia massiliensis (ex Durand et al. 2017)]